MSDNYTTIRGKLARRESFKGNSASGYRYPNGHYRVYSYDTEILSVAPDGRIVHFDSSHYSMTTSRLQNMIRAAFDVTGAPR